MALDWREWSAISPSIFEAPKGRTHTSLRASPEVSVIWISGALKGRAEFSNDHYFALTISFTAAVPLTKSAATDVPRRKVETFTSPHTTSFRTSSKCCPYAGIGFRANSSTTNRRRSFTCTTRPIVPPNGRRVGTALVEPFAVAFEPDPCLAMAEGGVLQPPVITIAVNSIPQNNPRPAMHNRVIEPLHPIQRSNRPNRESVSNYRGRVPQN